MIEDKDIPKAKGVELPTADEMKEKIKKQVKEETVNPIKPITKPKVNIMGITQLKDAVITICKFTNAIVESVADDGKITFGDFPKFINPVISLPAAISGIGEVIPELKDITPEEKAELVELVKDELEVGENAELIVEKALNILYELKALFDMLQPVE